MIHDGETLLWSWLHLSDIHFEHGDVAYRADQKLVLSRLRQDLPQAMDAAIRPQAVLVTGDIAFSGAVRSPSEYAEAAEYIARIREAIGHPVQVFTVPGNHDVQRTPDQASDVGALIAELRKGNLGAVDAAAADPAQEALLAGRFAHYSEFARQVEAIDANPIFWRHIVETPSGQRIHVLGVNSALLSNDNRDLRKLGVNRARIDSALADIEKDEIVLMLSHHPFAWLTRSDEQHLEQRADNDVHVHLHGHVHQAANFGTRHGTGLGRVTIVAGAVHGDQTTRKNETPVAHRYSIASLVEKRDLSIELRIHMRKWIGHWTRDADNERPDTYALIAVREAQQPAKPRRPAKKPERAAFNGIGLRASEVSGWLLPLRGAQCPELCPSADAESRDRALMSPTGALLAQQRGTILVVASVDHLGTSTMPWPSTFEIPADLTVIAVAESSAHDAVAVASSDSETFLIPLDRDTGEVGARLRLDNRPARFAAVDRGRVLLATWDGAVATCPAFTGIADVERLDCAALGGSTLVQAVGRDRVGDAVAFLLLISEDWQDISRLRRRNGRVSGIGVDLQARRPVVVGEAPTRTWRSMQRDSQIVSYDKWMGL